MGLPLARSRRGGAGLKIRMTVIENHFLAKDPAPDAASIAAALGTGFPLYERILEAAAGFELDWKHYGGKYGWKLKAHDGTKALFELTIASLAFRVSIAARESEMQALRSDPEGAGLLASALETAKAREGWGVRVRVEDEASCARAMALIRAVAKIRRAG
jgi:hypothetical protein